MSAKETEVATHVGRTSTNQHPPPPFYPALTPTPTTGPSIMTPSPSSLSPPALTPLRDTTYWKVVESTTSRNGAVAQGATSAPASKSILEAYLLCFPLGLLGAHHFYLGRISFGIIYFFTFGLLGCGWLVDLVRLPCLVSQVNKARLDKHQQLQALQQQLQQQHLQQQQQQYGTGTTARLPAAANVVFMPVEPRSLVDAYVLWFPFGLLGFHHFYLRNHGQGALYLFTFGLIGLGWLVDLFRLPSLVRRANSKKTVNQYDQCTAHVLAISPAGVLGVHHLYLNRPVWFMLYALTLGLVGAGWVYDWFRTSCLVKRANAIAQGQRSRERKYLDDAYILCVPFGFTGLHHFYLGRYGWGALYFFTLGIFGIGWVVDLFRLPCLVKQHNVSLEMTGRLATQGGGAYGTATDGRVISTTSAYPTTPEQYGYQQGPYPAPSYPTYPPQAGVDQAPPDWMSPPGYQATPLHNPTAPQGYTPQGFEPPSYEASQFGHHAATNPTTSPNDEKRPPQ